MPGRPVVPDAGPWRPALARRLRTQLAFRAICYGAVGIALLALATLLFDVLSRGLPYLTWDFLTGFPSRRPEASGVLSALVGTLYIGAITAVVAFPLGVAAAIYLEEYAGDTRLRTVVQTNISNLAGVPSIIYGMLGLAVFVRVMGFDRSVLAGGLTIALLVLPIVIINAQEAIRAVPASIRHASYALGATRWETTWHHVLPAALPGILTGTILALSRAIGEAAPIVLISGIAFIAFVPRHLLDDFTILPVQIFNWAGRPQPAFHDIAAAAIIVLLAVLLTMNALAIFLRDRQRRKAMG